MRSELQFGTAFLVGTFLASAATAQSVPAGPCPNFGADMGCGALITVTGSGATVQQTGMGPYDGSDDTLIGVVNNIPRCTPGQSPATVCGISIFSLDLSSSMDICGFDGDGIDTYGATPNAMDTTGYGGPNTYFTNVSADQTSCRANFMTPIPPGGTTYFSLENALNATACNVLLNNTLLTQTSKGNICAVLTPNQNLTIKQAAAMCGFKDFDWTQQITKKFDPSAAYARNANGGFDPRIAGPVRLTSKRVPWSDPPQGGGYVTQNGDGSFATSPPDNSYPFYYDQNTELASHENGSVPAACTLPVASAGKTLTFHDAPADPCLPGGFLAGLPATAPCTDTVLAPGANSEPAGSYTEYQTQLAGVNSDGTATNLGIGFTWRSNYDGTSGGVYSPKTDLPADGNGTGGVTITNVSQTSTYAGVNVSAINGSNNVFGPTSLLAAVLPESRSAQVNGTVTAFATIINTGPATASSCSIAPATGLPATFVYQTTNPTTNAVTGTANTPVDIAGNNGSQSFVIAFTPSAAISPMDVAFNFSCTNTPPAPIETGLNTLLLSASTTPTPDVIALAATLQNDGIVHATGAGNSGVFAVATDNLGSADTITVGANTGDATLPLSITICQTNPTTGACMQTPAAAVKTAISTNATPTFGIFVNTTGTIPFDPANSRIFVTFTDSTNAIRGETSVAVETQ